MDHGLTALVGLDDIDVDRAGARSKAAAKPPTAGIA
jgi:hypothetical protein